MNEIDFQELCRICLKDSQSHSYIYEERFSDHSVVFEVMNDVCQLDITMGDGYPEFLCYECHMMLSEFKSFKREAHKARATLQHMKSEKDTKNFQNDELNDECLPNEEDFSIVKEEPLQVFIKQEEDEEYFESNSAGETEEQCNLNQNEDEESIYNGEGISIKEEPTEDINEADNVEEILSEPYSSINPAVVPATTVAAQPVPPQRDFTGYLRVPRGPKPFECLECNRRFTKRSDLTRHSRLHTGEKDFCCMVCEKKFNRRSSLNQHMRLHTGERPFACRFCGKSYTVKSSLVTHLRLHTGENVYQCHECGKRFTGKRYLEEHFRMHTGEKPYECEVCGKRFSCSSHVVRHGKTHLETF